MEVKEQVPVKVVDAIMGSGKTTGMFNLMRDGFKQGKRYLYVSLFNSEVGEGNGKQEGRVHEELPEMRFKMPANRGEGKRENIKTLMEAGYNISTTHVSFKAFDREAIQMLIDGKYTLVIDEALDCISQFSTDKDSIDILLDSGRIRIHEEDGRLEWVGKEVEKNCPHWDIMKLCHTESLYKYKEDLIMWEYPPLLLKSLEDVYVITYLFEGSIMCSWMKKNGIEYKKLPHNILGLRSEEEIKQTIRDNIEILNSTSLNRLREKVKGNEHQFSSGWYKRNLKKDGAKDSDGKILPPTEMSDSIRKIMESIMVRTKSTNKTTFWTTFKSYKKGLSGKGYKQTPKNGLETFLPYNTKATNDYRDHTLCMYTVNVFKTPLEINYLASRGIDFDNDLYSLSEQIQLIFRGSIRKGEPMKLLIFSERMENLFKEWLYAE